jgi:hypothetical protein
MGCASFRGGRFVFPDEEQGIARDVWRAPEPDLGFFWQGLLRHQVADEIAGLSFIERAEQAVGHD